MHCHERKANLVSGVRDDDNKDTDLMFVDVRKNMLGIDVSTDVVQGMLRA